MTRVERHLGRYIFRCSIAQSPPYSNSIGYVHPLPPITTKYGRDLRMESSDRVLRERPPKVRKKRRKHSSLEVSPALETPIDTDTNTKDTIHVCLQECPKTPTHALFTGANFDFSPPGGPRLDGAPFQTTQSITPSDSSKQYLPMIHNALQLIEHASQWYSANIRIQQRSNCLSKSSLTHQQSQQTNTLPFITTSSHSSLN
ncbi:hypothetical protein L873DRAFT_267145 [Choiromyces venosus 120613-1]|uniref:Uncharacterized protein n=1 Tax=Choiromyces venosus 120613-1 TaxID=1336337 RepID=A0A3N4J3U0_9PEZI|nr:hypothetical protein L873DRAFT_267145 [Choiromyces venosus 120613-1]